MKNTLFNLTVILTLAVAIICVYVCTDDERDVYCNSYEGYYFETPEGFKADESFLPASVHFKSDKTAIEVYSFKGTPAECSQYIDYSSQAIRTNPVDYKNVISIHNRPEYSVLRWQRKKLKHVENDKNHYLKVDVTRGNTVYTILVKSSEAIGDYSKYAKLLRFHTNIPDKKLIPEVKKPRKTDFDAETQSFYKHYLKENKDIAWGIFHPGYMRGNDLSKYEEKIDHKFEILQWYTAFYNEYKPEKVKDLLQKAQRENKTLILTLQPSWVHDEGNDFLRLLDGGYDEFLEDYIKEIKNFGHPVMFRFANEMNGDWCEYCAHSLCMDTELYRLAYRYVFEQFEKHKVTNAIWVWNPNGKSYPDYSWNSEYMYYPGDEYVDVLGLTSYNTGIFYGDEKWESFEELYDPLYERCSQIYDMPFIITEFASSRHGGSKEKWTYNMLEKIDSYENIKIAVWWSSTDYNDEGDAYRWYRIDDSDEMIEIFRNYFKKP